jgi:thymidylate synthase
MYFNGEDGYLNLLKDTLANGDNKITRNGGVISAFGSMINFKNINECFPLITTKKMFFRGIVEELLWFLRGSTNANELKKKNVHIWDGNSTREYLDSIGLDYPEGELGPVYGWQWRKFGKEYGEGNEARGEIYIDINNSDTDSSASSSNYIYVDDKGVDQIKYIIEELLKETSSRRAVLSGWNPVDLKKMALPPCHILYIFNKSAKGLSCHMTLRSSDLFLGLPFNIASTALLTQILAHVLHINASEICLSICDAHIYDEHISQVNKQVNNEIYELPKVIIKKDAPDITSPVDEKIRWIESLVYEDFELSNYKSHAALSAIMK